MKFFALAFMAFYSISALAICRTNNECDDYNFCNGMELCLPTSRNADTNGCVLTNRSPCEGTRNRCDQAAGRCVPPPSHTDNDGDGSSVERGDCDDNDRNRFPGNPEVCDREGHDEDCDYTTYGFRDADGDGQGDNKCFNGTGNNRLGGADCDDQRYSVKQGAQICAGQSAVQVCEGARAGGYFATYKCPAGQQCYTQFNALGICAR